MSADTIQHNGETYRRLAENEIIHTGDYYTVHQHPTDRAPLFLRCIGSVTFPVEVIRRRYGLASFTAYRKVEAAAQPQVFAIDPDAPITKGDTVRMKSGGPPFLAEDVGGVFGTTLLKLRALGSPLGRVDHIGVAADFVRVPTGGVVSPPPRANSRLITEAFVKDNTNFLRRYGDVTVAAIPVDGKLGISGVGVSYRNPRDAEDQLEANAIAMHRAVTAILAPEVEPGVAPHLIGRVMRYNQIRELADRLARAEQGYVPSGGFAGVRRAIYLVLRAAGFEPPRKSGRVTADNI